MRHNVTRSLFGYGYAFFNTGDGGGGGGQQQGGDQGGQQQQSQEGAKPGDNGGGGQQGGGQQQQQQSQGGSKKYEYTEDRSNWLPKHRFDEVSKKATTAEAEINKLKTQLEAEQKRVRAALGIETPSPEDTEAEALRAAMTKLFPGLAKLADGKSLEQLEQIVSRLGAMEASDAGRWENHAEDMLGSLEQEVADALGVDELTDRQRKQLRRAYRDAADEAEATRRAQPDGDYSKDFLARHAKGDKSLLKEFAKDYVGDWQTSVKKAADRQAAQRFRPVPRGGNSRPITRQPPKGDMTKDTDFAEALAQARRDEGGQFGG